MIHSFTCKNFYSFKEETTLSFVVNKNVSRNDGYFTTRSSTRLSKVETVIGPNASGKTNLLKILPFLKWLIIDSFNTKPEDPIVIQPFVFGKAKNKPSDLSVVFEIEGNIYTYLFSLTKERILFEELRLSSFVNKKKSTRKIFSRTWNPKSNIYKFEGGKFGLPKGFENGDLLRKNASIVSAAARLWHTESQFIMNYWGQIETNVVEAWWIGDHLLPNALAQMGEAFSFFSENNKLKEYAEKLLRRFDLGLSGFEIIKVKQENGFSLNIRSSHQFNGEIQYLPIQYESSGTKQLFVLLKSILSALEKGCIAVIDEMDVNLHPEMVIALHNLFIHPETNPKNAQLFMSTHSHFLLSKLDKYQIVLVEKNDNGESEAWRLDEMSDVRVDDNYYTKYLAGAYGATPKI